MQNDTTEPEAKIVSCHLLLILALLSGGTPVALRRGEAGHAPVQVSAGGALEPGEQGSGELEEKAQDHLAAARALLAILKADLAKTLSRSLQLEDLYGEGLVSRRERDESAAQAEAMEARVARQGEVCNSTRRLLIELTQAWTGKPVASLPGNPEGRLQIWDIGLVPELANFFWHRFGQELPISAFGQTPTHDYLGFDHRDRVDLALHPNTAEGEAVIEYLRQRQLPFQAFSTARSGSATGAHIHIGPVSGRLED